MDCRGPMASQGFYPPALPSRTVACRYHPGFLGKLYPACARPPPCPARREPARSLADPEPPATPRAGQRRGQHKTRGNYSPGNGGERRTRRRRDQRQGEERGGNGAEGTGPRAPHLSERRKSPLCLLLPGGRGAAYRRLSPAARRGSPPQAEGRRGELP